MLKKDCFHKLKQTAYLQQLRQTRQYVTEMALDIVETRVMAKEEAGILAIMQEEAEEDTASAVAMHVSIIKYNTIFKKGLLYNLM